MERWHLGVGESNWLRRLKSGHQVAMQAARMPTQSSTFEQMLPFMSFPIRNGDRGQYSSVLSFVLHDATLVSETDCKRLTAWIRRVAYDVDKEEADYTNYACAVGREEGG